MLCHIVILFCTFLALFTRATPTGARGTYVLHTRDLVNTTQKTDLTTFGSNLWLLEDSLLEYDFIYDGAEFNLTVDPCITSGTVVGPWTFVNGTTAQATLLDVYQDLVAAQIAARQLGQGAIGAYRERLVTNLENTLTEINAYLSTFNICDDTGDDPNHDELRRRLLYGPEFMRHDNNPLAAAYMGAALNAGIAIGLYVGLIDRNATGTQMLGIGLSAVTLLWVNAFIRYALSKASSRAVRMDFTAWAAATSGVRQIVRSASSDFSSSSSICITPEEINAAMAWVATQSDPTIGLVSMQDVDLDPAHRVCDIV